MAKAVSSFFPVAEKETGLSFSTSPEQLQKSLDTNKEGHIRFIEVLLASLVFGNVFRARPYLQKGPRFTLTDIITQMAEKFVLAHEYSHHFLGHCSNEQRNKLAFTDIEIEQITRDWKDEFEADDLAMQITIESGLREGYDLALSYLGIDFVFSCMEIFQLAANSGPSATHPSACDRREALRTKLVALFPEEAPSMIKLSRAFQSIVTELWNRDKDIFEKAKLELLKNHR